MPKPTPSLQTTLTNALSRRRQNHTIRTLTTPPQSTIDFSSNDFLSLATNPSLLAAFHAELQNHPLHQTHLGSGGSRLLDGNSAYAESLETLVSTFHGAPTGLLCNSGFDANVGLFSCLPQPGDYVVYDAFVHASVHDGMRLSRCAPTNRLAFAHNDVGSLRGVLEGILARDEGVRRGVRNVFVAVETVYSMDGDVAPLREVVQAVKGVLGASGNGYCVVDEAHSTGVFGEKGRGLVCELGLEKEFLVRLHTFGKALACHGAILLCEPVVREYLVNYARPLIYTTFMSYPALAAIKAAYSFLVEGKTVALARNLRALISALHLRLLNLQESLRLPEGLNHLLRVPTDCPLSPIFAVLTSEPKALAAYCQCRGLMVRGIVPPTVPSGTERVRVCLHAGNTVAQIDSLIEAIQSWVVQRAQDSQTGTDSWARL